MRRRSVRNGLAARSKLITIPKSNALAALCVWRASKRLWPRSHGHFVLHQRVRGPYILYSSVLTPGPVTPWASAASTRLRRCWISRLRKLGSSTRAGSSSLSWSSEMRRGPGNSTCWVSNPTPSTHSIGMPSRAAHFSLLQRQFTGTRSKSFLPRHLRT